MIIYTVKMNQVLLLANMMYDANIFCLQNILNLASAYCVDTASEGDVKDQEGVGRHMGNNLR